MVLFQWFYQQKLNGKKPFWRLIQLIVESNDYIGFPVNCKFERANPEYGNMCQRVYFPFRWVKCGPFDTGTGDPCDKLIEKPSRIVSIDWVALTSLVWLCVHPSPMVMVVMDMVFMDIVDIDMVVSNFPQTRQDYLSFCKLFSYSLLMAEIWPIMIQDNGQHLQGSVGCQGVQGDLGGTSVIEWDPKLTKIPVLR